ncbi:protein mono-ADP-ribosyltransferase PARP9 [Engraulis encrasicolus]|uniref:protein mono-ADP-ribosyltransferase PARP9 n=1 Tax=Engraulis encrasicolus TaxID=184585 RepID=UPI002FCFF024
MDIVLQGTEVDIVGQCEQALVKAVTSKFGCTPILHGINNANRWDTTSAKKPKVTPEERWVITLPSGLKISVWKDDLTTHRVDAVVNAANEDLQHAGGLAAVLVKAGGPIIQQESDRITKYNGKVWTGQAVVTSAGKLPCKNVIHAVGPYVRRGADHREIDGASKYLDEAIDSILKIAESENLKSVAIPAISSGLFNFPLDRCATIIVKRLKKYSEHGRNAIREIHLVNNDERSVSEMTRACKQVFVTSNSSYRPTQPNSYSGAAAAMPAKPSPTSPVMNKVTLHVTKGHIEKQHTTAIVNTTNPRLDLSVGAVSKAISREAGNKLQSEATSTHGFNNYGDVVKTKGWNLHANFVYHVICQHKSQSSSATQSLQMLNSVVSKCLSKAEKDQCSSIAFPAIGSGDLGFTASEVAHIMTTAVRAFSTAYKGGPMDVYFVIYPSEDATFQAFMKEYAALQPSPSHSSAFFTPRNEPPAYEEKGNQGPRIELRSSSEAVRCAATKWVHDILDIQRMRKTTHSIRNNHIQHFGHKEHNNLLSLQAKFSVGLKVCYTADDPASIIVRGSPPDVTATVLEVEAMCCEIQEVYAKAAEETMLYSVVRWVCKDFPEMQSPEINATLERAYLAGKDVVHINSDISVDFLFMEMQSQEKKCKMERECLFKLYRPAQGLPEKSYFERKLEQKMDTGKIKDTGLRAVCVERVENKALEQLFELNKKGITKDPMTLYQRVPAQFCRFISWIGFQREYSPPDEQRFGQGIYFTESVKSAMPLWKGMEEEEYVYIVEAEVLTGKDTVGSTGLIVPPSKQQQDPLIRYDSVKGGTDIHVIFNGQQAVPRFIYTLKRM